MPRLLPAALVSHSALVLAGLKQGLEQRGDFDVVATHDSFASALSDLQQLDAQGELEDAFNEADSCKDLQ